MPNGLLNFSYGAAEELAAQSIAVLPGLALNTYSPGMTDLALGALALGQASWDLSSLAYHTWTGQCDSREEAPWQKTASSILKLSTGCALVARAYGRDPYSDTVLGVSLIAHAALALFRLGQNTYTELFLEQKEMQWKRAGRCFAGAALGSHSLAQGIRLVNTGVKELAWPGSHFFEVVGTQFFPKECAAWKWNLGDALSLKRDQVCDAVYRNSYQCRALAHHLYNAPEAVSALNELRKRWPYGHPICGEEPSFEALYGSSDMLCQRDGMTERTFDWIRRLPEDLSGEELCLATLGDKLSSLGRTSGKVAVLTRPISDWNGAFRRGRSLELLGQGIGTLYKTARITTAYTENMADVCSTLQKATDRHGKMVDIAVISGHGNPFQIRLGNQGVIDLFTDLSCLNDYLSENATVVLDSCSTAREGLLSRLNIAKWIALSVPGRTVVASSLPTGFANLLLQGDQWEFYHGGENDSSVRYHYCPGLEHTLSYCYESTVGRALAMVQKETLG